MSWRIALLPWLAAVVSGLMLALCYPGWDRSELVWFWQVPLLMVFWFSEPTVFKKRRWLWGALLGYVAGFSFFVINVGWIRHVAGPGWVLLAMYLAVYFAGWGAFAAAVGRLRKELLTPEPEAHVSSRVQSEKLRSFQEQNRGGRMLTPSLHSLWIAFLNAACWVTMEWLRGTLFTGFGWNGLGVALHGSPHLIQIADLVGVTGVAFLPMFVTCVLVATVARFKAEVGKGRLRPHLDFAAAMALLIFTLFYGLTTPSRHPVDDPVELRTALVQGNVSMDIRWNPEEWDVIYPLYEKYTSLYADQGYDLIVWPETCLPSTFFEVKTQRYLNSILAMGDFNLIIGNELFFYDRAEVYNAMILMNGSTGDYDAYAKMHLVPFGEYIPLRGKFPLFEWVIGDLIPEDFDAGTTFNRLSLEDPDVEIIPTICFEDTLGRQARHFVKDPKEAHGPEVILNVTNDAWFGQSEASFQHVANARFRTIELRRPMIRCANTGLTCVIDQYGSLRDDSPLSNGESRIFRDLETGSTFVSGVFPARVQLDSKPSTTLYARWGDWFALLMFLSTAGYVGWTLYPMVRKRFWPRQET